MANPWETFEAKVQERKTLPPLSLGDKTFMFPASPPAIHFFRLQEFEREHGHAMSDIDAVLQLLPDLLTPEEYQAFLKELTMEELAEFVVTLFTSWGWYRKDAGQVEAPNPTARPRSTKRSTRGSARSNQTSKVTTAST